MAGFMEKRSIRRKYRRRRRSHSIFIWLVVAIIFILGFIGVKRLISPKKIKPTTAAVKKNKTASARELKENTYLIVGLKKENGKAKATGLLLVVVDNFKRSIGGVIIPTNTFVNVSGRGFAPIAESYDEKMKTMTSTFNDFIGFAPKRYFIVPSDLFLSAVSNGDVKRLISQAGRSDASKAERKNILNAVSDVPNEKISLVDMPVRPIAIGEETYFEAKKNDLSRLLKLFWSVKLTRDTSRQRVIILNGSGRPGVARKAADNLLGKEFTIVDIKNADNFNYQQTQLIIYNKNKVKAANKVKKLLGYGNIITKNTPQDVVDIVIILGKDYQ